MTGISAAATTLEPALWRGMDRSRLDLAYDNAGHVGDSAARIAAWSQRSAAFRAERPQLLDLRYGPRERNRIDVFRCGTENAPLFVFIHGGYWQRNSKEVFSCLAEGPLARGFDVALPGYTLGPDATLTEIVEEMRTALAWLRLHGPAHGFACGRIIVGGWSAGAHLAALANAWPGVDGALLISGVFELEPIRLGKLNDKLHLTAHEVDHLSPLRHLDDGDAPAIVLAGCDELPELQWQSLAYAEARHAAGRPTELRLLPGENHFTILDGLISPEREVSATLSVLCRKAR